MNAENMGSGMTIRPRVKVPSDVSKMMPARNPRHLPPIWTPIKNVTPTQKVTANALGTRAANSLTPKIFIDAARAQ